MHYFDNILLLKQCYFDEKYSEFIRFVTFPENDKLEKVDQNHYSVPKYSGKAVLRDGLATSWRGIITKGRFSMSLWGMVRSGAEMRSVP